MMTKLKNVNLDAFGIGVLYELLEADDEMEKFVDLTSEQGLTKVLMKNINMYLILVISTYNRPYMYLIDGILMFSNCT